MNSIGFWVIYLAAFVLVVYQVFTVPITHDETRTILYTAQKNGFWDIMMYPDAIPNNHILNTLLTKLSVTIFGVEQWSARLPSMLSFFVYAYAVYRILTRVLTKRSMIFLPAAALFVANPYFLDFFSVSRGYALGASFCLLSVSYFLQGYRDRTMKFVRYGLIAAITSVYASFTLIVFWLAVSVLYFIFSLLNRKDRMKELLFLGIVNVGFIGLIAVPLYKIQSTEQLVFWTSNGFYEETLISTLFNATANSRVFVDRYLLSYFVIAVGLLALIYSLRKLIAQGWNESLKSPLVVITSILTTTILINIAQTWILRTPNLNGRTALFFFPMFVTLVISMREMIVLYSPKWLKILVTGLLWLIIIQHVSTTIRPHEIREWWYDRNNLKVINYIGANREGSDISLKTDWLFHPSFHFYENIEGYNWLKLDEYEKDISSNTDADYYYLFAKDYGVVKDSFEIVLNFEEAYLTRRISNKKP